MECGSEHVACEPEVEVSLTARGTANEGSGQFRMGVRSGLSFTDLKGLSIKKFRLFENLAKRQRAN